ncbi:MAG: nitroreductase family protein [Promethearchaeota archaeon]
MTKRRSVRQFKDAPVPKELVDRVVAAAFHAPSGAGRWGFNVVVVDDPRLKARLRGVCESGEKDWLEGQPARVKERVLALPNFKFEKEFLTEAPVLLVFSTDPDDPETPYAVESCWLAVGFSVLAAEELGLGTLTYTPGVLQTPRAEVLGHLLALPASERVQVILPLGYPAARPPPRSRVKTWGKVHHNARGIPYALSG